MIKPLLLEGGLQYFNLFHIANIFLPFLLFLVFYFCFRNKSKKVQEVFLFCISGFAILLFVAYKIYMKNNYDDFNWLGNLPLQLCNINLLIIPIALLTKNKYIFGFLYYIGVIGALIGIVMFDVYFIGRSPFSFAVLVYFLYHAILCIFPILIIVFKQYKPQFKHILPSILILLCLAFVMLCLNLFLINVCNYKDANYFYTMGMKGNPVMDFLWGVIPVPFLFFLPVAPVLFLFDYLVLCPHKFWKTKVENSIDCKDVEDEGIV